MAAQPFPILICENYLGKRLCGYSVFDPDGKVPPWCKGCQKRGRWRHALPGELTRSDRQELRRIRIAADAADGASE